MVVSIQTSRALRRSDPSNRGRFDGDDGELGEGEMDWKPANPQLELGFVVSEDADLPTRCPSEVRGVMKGSELLEIRAGWGFLGGEERPQRNRDDARQRDRVTTERTE